MIDQETVQLNVNEPSEDEVAPEAEDTAAATAEDSENEPNEDAEPAQRLVPVSESRRYRKRAQAAEKAAADLKQELAGLEADLSQERQANEDLRRGRQIDDLWLEVGAVDLETTRLLTELAASAVDEPDLDEIVQDLRRRKPFLFRQSTPGGGALSPRLDHDLPARKRLEDAATEAGLSGRRQDLLRYLRLRRKR